MPRLRIRTVAFSNRLLLIGTEIFACKIAEYRSNQIDLGNNWIELEECMA
jgi:hypothetical protein